MHADIERLALIVEPLEEREERSTVQALSGGVLAAMPLALKLRGKSTTQCHRAPIYYVDLTGLLGGVPRSVR